MTSETTRQTTLHSWHIAQGAKMVPFAGYDMPVNYPEGILAEHLHTRTRAGLFDVSHMGQIVLRGKDSVAAFEGCVPSSVATIKPGHMRYTVLMNDWGGVLDDLIMVRPEVGDDLWLIVNAGPKENDFAVLKKRMKDAQIEFLTRDLIALQGPQAAGVLSHYVSGLDRLGFMQAKWTEIEGMPVVLMRSGYTGEDGFEISVSAKNTQRLVQLLVKHEEVKPIGLGARDTLRLEAGLCLYGHELNDTITPIEAGLNWIIDKRKLALAEFTGAAIIESILLNKPEKLRVGIMVDDRTPARDGTEVQNTHGQTVGIITSGGFSPTLGKPIALAYLDRAAAVPGSRVQVMVRGRAIPAHVCGLPFVPHRYYSRPK